MGDSMLGRSLSSPPSDPDALIEHLKRETAQHNARQLITHLSQHCFDKCTPTPGSSLSKKEEGCLNACTEKYLNAWNVVSRAHITNLQKRGPEPGAGNLDLTIRDVE